MMNKCDVHFVLNLPFDRKKFYNANTKFIFMLRRFLQYDSFLTPDFKKPTYFTFILNASSG